MADESVIVSIEGGGSSVDLVEKLQYENTSARNLSDALKEEMRELTSQMATMKKENLVLKAQIAAYESSATGEKTASCTAQNETALSVTDSKLSGQSKLFNYFLYHTFIMLVKLDL